MRLNSGHSKSETVSRVLRLVPAALAAYELRYLLTRLLHLITGSRAVSVPGGLEAIMLILVATGSVLLLRESARGLSSQVGSPRWSVRLLRSWLFCTVGLGASLVTALTFTSATASGHTGSASLLHAIEAGNWLSAGPALLIAGLLLALSWHGAKWLLDRVGSTPGMRPLARAAAARLEGAESFRLTGAPLRAGWSDRGPPSRGVRDQLTWLS